MPLSPKGLSVKSKFQKRYGSKKGQRIFYATENSNKRFARAMKGR